MLKYVNMVLPRITEKKRLHTVVLERRGAEAITTEEPREEKLHAGICAGGAG